MDHSQNKAREHKFPQGRGWKSFIIRKGRHFSRHFPQILLFKKRLEFDAVFENNCLYDPLLFEGHVNKLFGMSFGFHHKSSGRIGWRSNGKSLQLFYYLYFDRNAYIIRKFATIQSGEQHRFVIERNGDELNISMDGEFQQNFHLRKHSFWGYLLFPYFGGQEFAPHDMNIQVRIVR